jgi:hypothetical protein
MCPVTLLGNAIMTFASSYAERTKHFSKEKKKRKKKREKIIEVE